ncbi:MAG: GIY-YIG nuclease family protein [Candidatus Nanoarchaeia archaeon]
MKAETIIIHLPDGDPKGVKICDFKGSTIKSIFFPRNMVDKVQGRDELGNPGVYFLFGERDDFNRPSVYIGEAEPLIKRIKNHIRDTKKEWQYAICFTSKESLNKAEIKHIEHLAYTTAKREKRCKVTNDTIPTKSRLSESDKAFAQSFFNQLKVLIGVLGFPIFEDSARKKLNKLHYFVKEAKAYGLYGDEGFIVLKGSTCNKETRKSAKERLRRLRKKLIDGGILKDTGKMLEFTQDMTFSSPSKAGSIIAGGHVNGWTVWKLEDGTTLDKEMRQKVEDGTN